MPTEEEVKKAKEEEEKRFEARVNERVAREAEEVRKREAQRWQAENDRLIAENRALVEAQKKRNEEAQAACLAEIETLKAEVDPAVLELFDALPAEISPEGKRDWLKKVSGKMPAPPPGKMPPTPNKGKVPDKKFEPYPIKHKII